MGGDGLKQKAPNVIQIQNYHLQRLTTHFLGQTFSQENSSTAVMVVVVVVVISQEALGVFVQRKNKMKQQLIILKQEA